jgi:hypothetical protein
MRIWQKVFQSLVIAEKLLEVLVFENKGRQNYPVSESG